MLFVTINATNFQQACEKIKQAMLFPIDGIELRLDFFQEIKIDEIKKIQEQFPIPKIFTLRKASQGGRCDLNEDQRLQLIFELSQLMPEYLDIEFDAPIAYIQKLHKQHPQIKLICSYHDFQKTPENLTGIFNTIKKDEFSIYKIATMSSSSIDTLRMLNFVYANNINHNLCGICMGTLGIPTRILAPVINNAINYACLNEKEATAQGQVDLPTLFNTYNYASLNQNTSIYALLGDPVVTSFGHVFHNQQFAKLKKNAVYTKFLLKISELDSFFKLIKSLPFKGFSVTMPLKEQIVPYLDDLEGAAKKIQTVNTILVKNKKYIGYNFDGIEAINTIQAYTSISHKKIVVIGAGGAAKAIIYEALQKGANVTILNRTLKRAENIVKDLGGTADTLDKISSLQSTGYDILINATSIGMAENPQNLPIGESNIIPGTIVLDMINTDQDTPLLKLARSKNCICINGREVYIKQAIEQEHLWFS